MKKRLIYIFSLLAGFCAFSVTSNAQDEEIIYGMDTRNVHLNKTVQPIEGNSDEYLITLEAFVTGDKETHEVMTRKPVDISLVLDLSGSMGGPLNKNELYVHPNAAVSYSYTHEPDYGYSNAWRGSSSSHPYYYSMSSTASSQSSEYYFRHTDGKYYEILHGYCGASDGKKYFGIDGSVYYIFYETGEKVTNPFDGTTINKRYFLGGNPTDGYTSRFCSNCKLPIILTGDDPTDADSYTPATGYYSEAQDAILYNGELYTASRLDALRNAVYSFIDVVKQDDAKNLTDASGHHRVGIVKFASAVPGATTIKKGYLYKTSSSSTSWYNSPMSVLDMTDISEAAAAAPDILDQFQAAGSTRTSLGMSLAQEMINGESDGDDRSKIVVFFTDGEPTQGNNYSETEATNTVKIANKLKAAGVQIYVVGLVQEATENGMKFMEYVSSDYPDATSMDNAGAKSFDKYCQLASSGSQLTQIFENIANHTATTEIGYDLRTTGQVVLDALTDHFMLPEDVTDNSRIRVYTRKFVERVDEKYIFEDPSKDEPLESANIDIGGENGKQVIVSGFDFAANWCGQWRTVHATGKVTSSWQGNELVITIPIKIDPANPGGANEVTNESYSGIYIEKEGQPGVPDMDNPIGNFTPPLLSLPNIIIRRDGMAVQDNAVYKIYKLTADGNPDPDWVPYTIMLCEGKAEASVKLLSSGRYKVVEDTSWSWAYEVKPVGSYTDSKDDGKTVVGDDYVIRNVGESTADDTKNGTIFSFGHTSKTGTSVPSHGEDSINNVFYTPKTVIRN